MSKIIEEKNIYSISEDPIYIGTGGYTIGRVDNTIIRDPITKIPKIPATSLAGTWRYYMALKLQSAFKDDYKDKKKRKNYSDGEKTKKILDEFIRDEIKRDKNTGWITEYGGNRFAGILCAGQDEKPQISVKTGPDLYDETTGHCGHCIVCRAFGYSKRDISWQGMLFFTDLNIVFFPVYTRFGVKWITSLEILKKAEFLNDDNLGQTQNVLFVEQEIENGKSEGYINLGWLNLPYKIKKYNIKNALLSNVINTANIIIVPHSIISQIINSNLEVRTSVSINPITGAAREKALFTSEAIPRGTIFYGKIRLFNKKIFYKDYKDLPEASYIWQALEHTKEYYETLGIGGMTTRGFGRMKILSSFYDQNINGGNDNESKS